MKKTTRNILIMLGVLVLAGGLLLALTLMPPQTEETASEPEATPAPTVDPASILTDREASEVLSVTISNPKDTFRLVPVGSGNFVPEGYDGFALNQTQVNYSVTCLLDMKAEKDLGKREDLINYGLAGDAETRVTVEYTDGTKDQWVIGNEAGETVGRYVLRGDSVCIVSGLSKSLFDDVFGYFSAAVYSIPDRTESKDNGDGTTTVQTVDDRMEHFYLSGANFPEEIRIDYDPSVISKYTISAPVAAESGSDKFSEMVSGMKSLSASRVVDVFLTGEKLEAYGLKEPYATVDFQMNGEKHVVSVSKKDSDGNRYLIADDKDTVYRVAASAVSAWAETSIGELRMSYVFLPNIKHVSRMELTAEGEKPYRFTMTRTRNEEKSDDSGDYYDITPAAEDGREISYSTSYQPFYMTMLSIAVLSSDKAEYDEKAPLLQIRYSFFENRKDSVLAYYPAGQDRCAAVIDGKYGGLVRRSDVEKLVSLLPVLEKGETIEHKD